MFRDKWKEPIFAIPAISVFVLILGLLCFRFWHGLPTGSACLQESDCKPFQHCHLGVCSRLCRKGSCPAHMVCQKVSHVLTPQGEKGQALRASLCILRISRPNQKQRSLITQ